MKQLFTLFMLLMLLSGGQGLMAQGASLNAAQSSMGQPEMFTIVDAQSGSQLIWYVEQSGISNEIGEQIVPFSGDSRTSLLTFLEQFRNDSRVASFDLDQEHNRLTISMTGKSADQLFSTLTNSLKSPASTH